MLNNGALPIDALETQIGERIADRGAESSASNVVVELIHCMELPDLYDKVALP